MEAGSFIAMEEFSPALYPGTDSENAADSY